ncbi:MAG: hypothetical protein WCR46_02360 [Deltaproteobacteria bacterium]
MLKLVYDSNQVFVFSSEAIASILGKDHQDIKDEIRNIHMTDFAKAYAIAEDGNSFIHDYWIGNFNQVEDGTIMMTENGLWFFLWSMEGMPSPAVLARIVNYLNAQKSQVYYQSIDGIQNQLMKAGELLQDAIFKMSVLQKPSNLIGKDTMPETISAVKRMMNVA